MKDSQVQFYWQRRPGGEFRTGVSLHSHTLHSKESMDFIDRATANTPWLSGAIRKQRARYRELKGRDVDMSRAWWTPPLSPRQAWDVERKQVERMLGMQALVSLSDHDTMEAPLQLHVVQPEIPLSVEWTVPYRQTFFHVGIHNLPGADAAAMMREMAGFTANPEELNIAPMLEWLGSNREALVVLNHPRWDENHIGEAAHGEHVTEFLRAHGQWIHALELNGLRPWPENQQAAQLATRFGLPLISGGDRHGREPNACVNLTNATTFGEFAAEVRCEQRSHVLFMPQYEESLRMRIVENLCDILEDDPNHAMGWVKWSDRVFYRTDEGDVKSVGELWGARVPSVVNQFVSLMGVAKHKRVRSALRVAFSEKREFAL